MKACILSIVAIWIADRGTKWFAQNRLQYANDASMPLWEGIMRLSYRRNTGAAFSAFHGNNAFLTISTCVLVLAVGVALYTMRKKNLCVRSGLALVLAGGLGNLTDRFLYGYVVDFIELLFVRFAVFNIADCAICVGVGLALIGWMIEERREKRDAAR